MLSSGGAWRDKKRGLPALSNPKVLLAVVFVALAAYAALYAAPRAVHQGNMALGFIMIVIAAILWKRTPKSF